jgi:hypothetical protein
MFASQRKERRDVVALFEREKKKFEPRHHQARIDQ